MNQVNVSINGRSYVLNCGVGEEEKLIRVVEYLDSKITQLDKVTKQSGDTNLMLAAALLASSEVLELRTQLADKESALTQAQSLQQESVSSATKSEAEAEANLIKLTERVESLTAVIEEQLSDREEPVQKTGTA